MDKCLQAILSIVPDKSSLLSRECVKENKLYQSVLSALLKPLSNASERVIADQVKFPTNLVKVGIMYDTLYNRLHTGQWNAVEPADREMFTILTYVRIVYALCVSTNYMDALKDAIYLADLGIMLGYPLKIEHKSIATDLLEKTSSTLAEYLSEVTKEEVPLKRLRLDVTAENITTDESNFNCVPVLKCPSIEYFGLYFLTRKHFYDVKKPALLKGIIDGWPAMERWHDPNYLLNVAGERTVPIEIGSQYSNDDWSQKLMRFRDFIEQNICNETSATSSGDHRTAYLAQHDLFDQIPTLRADIAVPDYIGRTDTRPRIKAWFGPKGTISPLHTDPCHNLLCQVFGAKTVILARPEDTEKLYPHDHFILSNTSQVDARQPDYERFPLARDVSFYRVTLHRGEVLYIPPKWWHYVESLSTSFSVSFWFE
ncbi:bifunctional peptidase and arginyl-hydroxylase JMJD5 [Anopheles maculipalpis]|uniref:bifunctional peptidase and arginyl-hydroxylase JMJD5 n=1 Tax=Anopheles maculipalpis TaxID=1496333 RepID=UPI002158F647|nr:bifunctional peptidase and arginyl-hydroxylase JMJD5 [Anopheles maculipalpis]